MRNLILCLSSQEPTSKFDPCDICFDRIGGDYIDVDSDCFENVTNFLTFGCNNELFDYGNEFGEYDWGILTLGKNIDKKVNDYICKIKSLALSLNPQDSSIEKIAKLFKPYLCDCIYFEGEFYNIDMFCSKVINYGSDVKFYIQACYTYHW